MTPNWVTLFETIRTCWDADTSAAPEEWTPENRALGQADVTTLVVQDHLGGTIMCGTVNGVAHYWNRFSDGTTLDLTITQFPTGSDRESPQVHAREAVLSTPDAFSRHRTLKARVAARLSDEAITHHWA